MVSRTVDLDGPVHYYDFGGTGTPLVCVHGLGGAALNWMAVGQGLARGHHVLAPDLRGFGYTPLNGKSSAIVANQRLLDRFLREVAGSPATVIGNSMGGLLSVLQAAHHPETVQALVLVDPALPWRGRPRLDIPVWAFFGALLVPGLAEWRLRRRLRRWGSDRLAADTLTLVAADPWSVPRAVREAHLELARERARSMDGERALVQAARSLAQLLLGRNFEAMYRAVRAPVLILHGERDRLVPFEFSVAMARRYGWQLEVLAGVGHIPMLETPDRFVRLTLDWLASALQAAV